MILATLACFRLEYELVTPQVWTKTMLDGIPKNIETKDRSKLAVSRIFGIDQFIVEGSRKPHSGLVDAALIGLYGYKKSSFSVV